MLFPKVLPLASALALTACTAEMALEERAQPIINGEACDAATLPQTVALIVDAKITFQQQQFPIRALMCTGTLIAPDTVLTAAHCVDPTALTGGFGELEDATYYISTQSDLSELAGASQTPAELPVDALPASRVVGHETFSLASQPAPGLGNFYDIGLVFLEEPLTTVEPAIVMTPAEAAEHLAVGDEVRIAGWGQRGADQNAPAGLKQCATTNIFELGDYEMQIGNEPETARKCHGDSGGPTYVSIDGPGTHNERVIGATSRAYDESDCQKGGIDTMASAWYEWIDARMTEGCESGERSWCEVPGVVPPEFYEEGEGEGEGEGEDDDDESGGCSTSTGSTSWLAGLMLLVWAARRRFAR